MVRASDLRRALPRAVVTTAPLVAVGAVPSRRFDPGLLALGPLGVARCHEPARAPGGEGDVGA